MTKISHRFHRSFLITTLAATAALSGASTSLAQDISLPGLEGPVTVHEDALGIPTVVADSELDVAYVQGYLHGRDRLFQMDFTRRQALGTISEMLGSAALSNDIQLRTLGLGRAALATWQAMDPDIKAVLKAYSDGVNAAARTLPLPPEYAALELTSFEPWTPLDSVALGKLLAFGLSFDLDIDRTISLIAYQTAGNIGGFNGQALFFEDTHRSQPADGRVTVPGFLQSIGGIGESAGGAGLERDARSGARLDKASVTGVDASMTQEIGGYLSRSTLELAQRLRSKWERVPLLNAALSKSEVDKGSNWWIVGGQWTEDGYPLIANDPHLSLDSPTRFYEVNLVSESSDDPFTVAGLSFPGTPLVVQGCNEVMCWGSTVHPMDVTDVYQEQVQTNIFGLPTHTLYQGNPEPIQVIFQSYFVNTIGDGTADNLVRANVPYDAGGITFVVPRRNNGPILDFDPSTNTAFSVQYAGWGPTFELDSFREIARAQSPEEFAEALQLFDVGSQNFGYADINGNIAYWAGAENPIRADLAQGTVDGGIPPFIIRDGTGALNHEWLEVQNPQPDQALPYEIMPFSEMPQVVNPASGYIANGNNDPVGVTLDNNPLNQLRPGGNGIYYLNPGYAPYRMGRIDRVMNGWLDDDQPVGLQRMKNLQGNDELLDAELVLPMLLAQFDGLQLPPEAPLAQALDVLSTWDYSSPTGITEGYDAGDDPMMASPPDETEIRHSAAATVFAVWRSMLIRNTIDATLQAIGLGDYLPGSNQAWEAFQWHLKNFDANGGVGASGVPFFSQGLAPTVQGSLQQALDLLASDEFAPAFANSLNVMDYRWGKLHRVVFDHPLGVDPLNIPNGGGFMDLAPELPGIARQGGYQAVDASSHSARANGLNEFMFGAGPNRRKVASLNPSGIIAEEVIPGGQSGIFLSPNYSSQLPLWLTNRYHQLYIGKQDGIDNAVTTYEFTPSP